MQKEQKIKSKYQKYANIMFLLISGVIVFLVYILIASRNFGVLVEYEPPPTMDGFNRQSKSFQPSDERAQSPGKLKWGRDFDFAKSKRSE
ncbi:MAG: hypothetical protein HRT43_14190 [Campylobacteraceae bacterium]|nr:hypothetical protein [Campylobacteraceae bacterium]